MKITVEMVMAEHREEYPEERIRELWAGRESLSPEEVAELDIPILDRAWIILEVGKNFRYRPEDAE